MKSTGRNEPCPCGSGTKYKHCCERKDSQPFMSRMGLVLGIAIAIVLVGGVAALFNDPSNDAETERRLKDVLQGRSKAPVSAPAVPAAAPTPLKPAPQPPGPAPVGKVWSTEHGHWHDAPIKIEATRQGGLTASTSPEPPAQKGGLEWNEEHGHYHRVNPVPAPDPNAAGPTISIGPDGQARVKPGASTGDAGTEAQTSTSQEPQ